MDKIFGVAISSITYTDLRLRQKSNLQRFYVTYTRNRKFWKAQGYVIYAFQPIKKEFCMCAL